MAMQTAFGRWWSLCWSSSSGLHGTRLAMRVVVRVVTLHTVSPHALSTNEQLWVKSCWGDEGRISFLFSFIHFLMCLSLQITKGPNFPPV